MCTGNKPSVAYGTLDDQNDCLKLVMGWKALIYNKMCDYEFFDYAYLNLSVKNNKDWFLLCVHENFGPIQKVSLSVAYGTLKFDHWFMSNKGTKMFSKTVLLVIMINSPYSLNKCIPFLLP